ncbi:phage infection protein [Chloroflexota bacterium]
MKRVLGLLGTTDFKTALEDYIKKYNELLAASTYFKKGTFNYYNAATIAKNLADNGFFDAKHTVNLNATETLVITSKEQLEELIDKEKERISSDKVLRTKFTAIEKQLYKNASVRNFGTYLADHEEILSQLANPENFKEEIWKSYIKMHIELYKDLLSKYRDAEKRKEEIEKEASKERTQWERVIEIFNDRFFVPFDLFAKNKVSVILGQDPMLLLGFTFNDGPDKVSVEKDELMKVLSTGESRAFYILNIIFEVEARKKAMQETIFVIDDIADSFDYKNKYAIIQYLQDISEESYFYQIILTHNFDFFRTINSRFISYSHCLMATRGNDGIALTQAIGIKNIFVNDWKLNFFDDPKKKIASIPFIRNIIEYTKGEKDPMFIKLTSLLHWKADTSDITQDDLDCIYNSVFGTNGNSAEGKIAIIDLIHHEASECLDAEDSINFENKIILSIAIRITAEKFMVDKIKDPTFVASIDVNQTPKLQAKFKALFSGDQHAIETIQKVILMTPDNIHMNSFMYEPILDMAEDHLKKLYEDVLALS